MLHDHGKKSPVAEDMLNWIKGHFPSMSPTPTSEAAASVGVPKSAMATANAKEKEVVDVDVDVDVDGIVSKSSSSDFDGAPTKITDSNAWNKTNTGFNYNTRKANNDVLAWKCPKCSHNNDLGHLICATKKCGAWKGKIERCDLVYVPNTLAISVNADEEATDKVSKPTTTATVTVTTVHEKKKVAANKSNLSCHSKNNKKELAWKCSKCSRHNSLSHLRCATNNCCVWKGGSKSSTRTSTQGCDLVWGVERDECVLCGYGGELICCDSCDKVYHGNCLQIGNDTSTLPDPWHCPACCLGNDEPRINEISTKEDFQNYKSDLLSRVPKNVKSRFREGGFSRWGKDWLPVLELGPFDVEPGPVRDMWLEMFDNTQENGRDMTRLVFWYGVKFGGQAYSFVPETKIMKYEEGNRKGFHQMPKKIQNKIEKNQKLTKTEEQIRRGLKEIEGDMSRDKADRVAWMMQFKEEYEGESPDGNKKLAAKKSIRHKCGACHSCLREDCGVCRHCLDKPKYGGPYVLKQACIHKRCPFKRYSLPATVSPEMKRERVLGRGKEEGQQVAAVVAAVVAGSAEHIDFLGSVEQSLTPQTAVKRKHVGAMYDAAYAKAEEVQGPNRSKRACKQSSEAVETDTGSDPLVVSAAEVAVANHHLNEVKEVPGHISRLEIHTDAKASSEHQAVQHSNTISTTVNESGIKSASSIAVATEEEDDDDYSQITLPLPKVKSEANSANDATDNNPARNDLGELEHAREENKRQGDEIKRQADEIKRQADEIKRLKSAVQALTASLIG